MTRYAIGVPNLAPFADVELLVALAMVADERGWDGFFLWDHVLYRDDRASVDPWVALGAIATSTARLRIGVMVAALPRALPWEVAKRVATLDRLSGGRFTLGAGLGSMPEEYTALGLPTDARVRADRLDESLAVIEGLWTAAAFAHAGEHFQIDAPPMLPTPEQSHVPIWIGGKWPARRPFRRAARFDGVIAVHEGFGKGTTMPPDVLAEIVEYVRAHRAADAPPFDVAIEGTTPGDDVDAYVRAGLTWWIETLGWWRGGADEALARVEAGPPA